MKLNKLFLIPLFLFVASAVSLLSDNSVSATSVYDTAYNHTDTVRVESNNYYGTTCSSTDLTNDWVQYILDDTTWYYGSSDTTMLAAKASFQIALDNSTGWSVSERINYNSSPSNFQTSIIVTWNENPDYHAYFADFGSYQGMYYGNKSIIITNNPYGSGCSIHAYGYTSGTSEIISSNYSSSGYIGVKNLFINAPITYPTDYDGITPPDSVPPELIPADYWLNFSYTNTPTSLSAKYINKETDPVTSLPDPDWVWWQLRINDGDDTTIDEVVCDKSVKKTEDFNSDIHCHDFSQNLVIDKSKNYYLTAKVNPIDNENLQDTAYDITFLDTVFKIDFNTTTIGSTTSCDGGAILSYMKVYCTSPTSFNIIDCFSDTFPFVDIEGCTETFSILTSYLVFGGVRFPEWDFTYGCRNLDTLDNWLNLPSGYQVCPQIPSSVRNILTPFIAFLLGVVTLGFVHKRTGDFNG